MLVLFRRDSVYLKLYNCLKLRVTVKAVVTMTVCWRHSCDSKHRIQESIFAMCPKCYFLNPWFVILYRTGLKNVEWTIWMYREIISNVENKKCFIAIGLIYRNTTTFRIEPNLRGLIVLFQFLLYSFNKNMNDFKKKRRYIFDKTTICNMK